MMTSNFVRALECLYVRPQSRICTGYNMAVNSVQHSFLCNNSGLNKNNNYANYLYAFRNIMR